MCEVIIMPDGKVIESISEDGVCFCNVPQSDILAWIVTYLPEIKRGERVEIERTPIGYEVTIRKLM